MLDWPKQLSGYCLIVLWAVMSCASSAHANPLDGRHAREGRQPPGGPYQQQSTRDVQRPYAQPYERRDTPGPQRLSPDERRQLRRDIQDAGREIYPSRR